MKNSVLFVLALALPMSAASERARNVILFVGDAGGLPVLNAAAAYKGKPQSLFIQQMPNIGLSDSSSASAWVTDSAAGMTAIMTGQKTHNGVISQSATAQRNTKDGDILTTVLEYAEAHGLSTGVVTNDVVTGATAAACYAHTNERKKAGAIFAQLLQPRSGDGVDLLIGAAGTAREAGSEAAGTDMTAALRGRGYAVLDELRQLQPSIHRAIVLLNSKDFDVADAVKRAIAILSQNPKGYFLMVESDLHTTLLKRGLDRALALDQIIEHTTKTSGKDTLVIFCADHSFDTRLKSGNKGDVLVPAETVAPAAPPAPAVNPPIRVDSGHTGEEVIVAAQGPGAERVKGFFPNTHLFHVMMAAYGWQAGQL